MTDRTCSEHARGNRRPPRSPLAADTLARAALLAAVLPNPRRLRVDAPSDYVRERQAWVMRQMQRLRREGWIMRLAQ